jgi:hypothetical protein
MGQTKMPRLSFDAAFAGPSQWASMYRALGLQVVPAHMPQPKPAQWKRPAIKEWKQFQEELIPFSLFDKWYGEGEQFAQHRNLGMITGRASNNVFVLDLDTYKSDAPQKWWEAQCFINNGGKIPHSWRSRTGSGGRHLFFKAPETWLVPNNNTSLGVDIKGQGGFVVLPPSLHTDGVYAWEPGYSPFEVGELEEAPRWLLDAIDELAEMHGGHIPETRAQDGEPVLATPSPASDINAWGRQIDGRESAMTKAVYAGVMKLRRERAQPTADEIECQRQLAFNRYLQDTATRLPGFDNAAGLEREGRGETLFNAKWRRLLGKWGTSELEAAAARPNPHSIPDVPSTPRTGSLILTGSQFVAGFTPPDYLVHGILQRGYLYSMTARTGHGKTVVTLYLAQAIARGQPIHGRRVKPGPVLYFAGENPDDIRAKYLVLADNQHFDIASTPVHFIAGTLDLAQAMADIQAGTEELRPILVVVDTGPAYFRGDDANSNAQQGAFARLLRHLTTLPGLPAVIVNTHPNKDAREDQLTPGGGGATPSSTATGH